MSQQKPQNLIFIFSDQHNREKIGCYGDPYAITPNLDRLASAGTLFENAYCNSPVCVPSRSSMITGDYPHKNNFWDNAHPYCGEQKGFGHVLTEQGFSITRGTVIWGCLTSGFPSMSREELATFIAWSGNWEVPSPKCLRQRLMAM